MAGNKARWHARRVQDAPGRRKSALTSSRALQVVRTSQLCDLDVRFEVALEGGEENLQRRQRLIDWGEHRQQPPIMTRSLGSRMHRLRRVSKVHIARCAPSSAQA